MKQQNKRQEQARRTKEKIFSCATRLLAQKPFEYVTVGDICREAQVSVGAFYHHFESKENLLNEGYRLFDQDLQAAWEAGHPDEPLECIRFLIGGQMQAMERIGVTAAAQYYKNQLSTEVKYVLDEDRFFYVTLRAIVEQEVVQGRLVGDAHLIVEDLLSVCRGIIYDWCLHGGSYRLTKKGARVPDMVLKYYQTEETQ